MSKVQPGPMWRIAAAATAATLSCALSAAAQPPLEALPSILQLQLSQHPAWRAYKDAAAERQSDAAHAASETARLNAMTTPERLNALRGQMQAQEQSFDREAAATDAFYAALSPDQRHLFDDVTRAPTPPSPMRADNAAGRGPQVLRLPPPGSGLTPPAP